MSLFANKEKRAKLYFNSNCLPVYTEIDGVYHSVENLPDGSLKFVKLSGKVEERTDWIEIRGELSISEKEIFNSEMKVKTVEARKGSGFIVDVSSIKEIPMDFVSKMVTGWSQKDEKGNPEPINPNKIAELSYPVISRLWQFMSEVYGISAPNNDTSIL